MNAKYRNEPVSIELIALKGIICKFGTEGGMSVGHAGVK